MHITINEPPRSKKNSMQIVKFGSRPALVQSKSYREYESLCAVYFKDWVAEPIDYPVNLKCDYYMPSKRKVDITNLMSATHDILVKYGVLADDNRDIVASVDGSRVFYDKHNPRTEIEITPYDGDYDTWKSK